MYGMIPRIERRRGDFGIGHVELIGAQIILRSSKHLARAKTCGKKSESLAGVAKSRMLT